MPAIQPVLSGLLILCLCGPAHAEETGNREVLASLPAGELLPLTAGEQTFTALYQRDRSGRALGAVLILHGYGKHLDWPEEIRPLREELPDHGWATLSLPLPDAPPALQDDTVATTPDNGSADQNTDNTDEAPAQASTEPAENMPDASNANTPAYMDLLLQRMRSAQQFLRDEGQTRLVLVGQNQAAVWATQYFLNSSRESVAALVLLNADNRAGGTTARIPRMLEILGRNADQRPLLDLLLPQASATRQTDAGVRLASARREHLPFYRQRALEAPSPNLSEASAQGEDLVARSVRSWLHSMRQLLPANEGSR